MHVDAERRRTWRGEVVGGYMMGIESSFMHVPLWDVCGMTTSANDAVHRIIFITSRQINYRTSRGIKRRVWVDGERERKDENDITITDAKCFQKS